MPILAAGNSHLTRKGSMPVRRYAEHGFTLVEMMVVIVLIGVASAAVVWTLPDPRGRLTDEAERFAGRARAAHDLAIAGARPVSLWVTASGYGFDERRGGAWVAISDTSLRVARWGEGTRAQISGARERVVFDPTGLVDHGLALRLERGTATGTVTIGGDGDVKVGK